MSGIILLDLFFKTISSINIVIVKKKSTYNALTFFFKFQVLIVYKCIKF